MRFFLACMLLAGCADDGFSDCTTTLSPSGNADTDHDNIQTALGDARPGDVICFKRGTFQLHDELDLTTPNVELRGSLTGGSVLDFAGQAHGANGVSAMADGFLMSWLTIKNTAGDGVRISKADGVTLRHVDVSWDAGPMSTNGGYGIYPTECSHVLVEYCRTRGASDTGIYVGQSRDIIVRDSEVSENVAGIEIENSYDAEVYRNRAHDNVAGILVFSLPELPQRGCARVSVHDNQVDGNNLPSFAPPGSIVSQVPAGTGIMVISASDTEVHDNSITGNESIGAALVSFLIVHDPRDQDPAYDPYPKGNWFHDNSLSGNGEMPQGMADIIAAAFGASAVEQVVWDGTVDPNGGDPNCFHNAATFRNLDFPHSYKGATTELGAAGCAGKAIAALPQSWQRPGAAPPSSFVPKEHLSEYGFFMGPLSMMQPAPGVMPYEVNASLFADGATKNRFLVLPAGGKIHFDPTGRWTFPDGTTLVKTFASGSHLIETRLLMLRDGVWWTQTYLWDDAQTEATRLVPGRTVTLPSGMQYRVPSSDQCKTCHGHDTIALPLGPRTRQLNRTHDYGAGPENQIDHLAKLGAFDGAVPAAATLEKLVDPFGSDDVNTRARSYLEANCAHCHSDGGFASSTDLRLNLETPVGIDLGICRNPNAAGPGSGTLIYDVVPGKPDESILIYRMTSVDPETKMPPLPALTDDMMGADLLRQFIAQLPAQTCQ